MPYRHCSTVRYPPFLLIDNKLARYYRAILLRLFTFVQMNKGMRKRLCIVGLLASMLLATAAAWAAPISRKQAERYAVQYFQNTTPLRGERSLALLYTSTGVPTRGNNDGKDFYVFGNPSGKGFVVVAGDDVVPPILGYSTTTTFPTKELPAELASYLAGYSQWLRQAKRTGATEVLREEASEVAPLLQGLIWNQTAPYNLLTPESGGKHAPTGCVATAAAQVMRYFAWPPQAKRSASSDPDFGQKPFDWDNMPDNLTPTSQETEKQAVAHLMYEIGRAVNMQYNAWSSASSTTNAYRALLENFDYAPSLRYVVARYYTPREWQELMLAELKAARPVFYTGYNSKGTAAHAFVLDGYDGKGYFHVNWGWGGMSDGYFLLHHLVPSAQGAGGGSTDGYSILNDAIIGFQPSVTYTGSAKAAEYVADQVFVVDDHVGESSTQKLLPAKVISLANTTITPVKVKSAIAIVDAQGLEKGRFVTNEEAREISETTVIGGQEVDLNFADLPDGVYTLRPYAYEVETQTYRPVRHNRLQPNAVTVTVHNGKKTVLKGDGTPRLEVSWKNTDLNLNVFNNAEWTVKNTGTATYFSRIQAVYAETETPVLPRRKNDLVVSEFLTIAPGESYTLRYPVKGPFKREEKYLHFLWDANNNPMALQKSPQDPSIQVCPDALSYTLLSPQADFSLGVPQVVCLQTTDKITGNEPLVQRFKVTAPATQGVLLSLACYVKANGQIRYTDYLPTTVLRPSESKEFEIKKHVWLPTGTGYELVVTRKDPNINQWQNVPECQMPFTVEQGSDKLRVPKYEAQTSWFGHYDPSPSLYRNRSGNGAGVYDVAIRLDGKNAAQVGKKIKALHFYLRDKSVLKEVHVWASPTLPNQWNEAQAHETPDLTTLAGGDDGNFGKENTVTFANPITLTAEGAYIGITLSVKDGTTEASQYPIVMGLDLDHSDYHWRHSLQTPSWAHVTERPYVPALRVQFEGFFPKNAAAPYQFSAAGAITGLESTADVRFVNHGGEPIYRLHYTVTTSKGVSQEQEAGVASNELKGLGADCLFTAQLGTFDTEGEQEVTVTITRVNGEPNEAGEKSVVGRIRLHTPEALYPRNALVEEFTSTKCGYCAAAHGAMDKLHAKYGDRFVGIALHMRDRTDPMYIAEGQEYTRLNFPASPRALLWRNEPSISPFSVDEFVEKELKIPAFAEMTLTPVRATGSREITVTTSVTAKLEGEYYIAYVLCADNLMGTTSAWHQSDYEGTPPVQSYRDVAIASTYRPGHLGGDPIALQYGATQSHAVTLRLPDKQTLQQPLEKATLSVVAILTDAQGRVINTVRTKVEDGEQRYLLSLSTSENGTLMSSVQGHIKPATAVVITPKPAEKCHLKSIVAYKTGEETTTVALTKEGDNYTFSMPAHAVTVKAEFAKDEQPTPPTPTPQRYRLTVVASENGTVTATPSGELAEATEVTLTVVPAEGYHLALFTLFKTGEPQMGVAVTKVDATHYTFSMPAHAVTVKAEFAKDEQPPLPAPQRYRLTVVASENGTVTSMPSGELAEATEVTLTVVPAEGYHLALFTLFKTGEPQMGVAVTKVDATHYTFTMPAHAVTVKAEFAKDEQPPLPAPQRYRLTVAASANGAVTATPSGELVEATEVTLTVVPAEGYHLATLKLFKSDEPTKEVTSTKVDATHYTFTMPAHAVTVKAEFAKDEKPTPPTPDQPQRPAAVEDTQLSAVTVAPNPFATHLRIVNPEGEAVRYELLTLTGCVVRSGRLDENEVWVDTETLPSGIYFVRFYGVNSAQKSVRVLRY